MENLNVRELLQLYLYDELPEPEKRRVENLLSTSGEYRAVLEDLKKLHRTLAHRKSVVVTENLIIEARNQLRASLHGARKTSSWKERIAEFIDDSVFTQYKVAFGSVATVALGFLLGYVVFSSPGTENKSVFTQTSAGSTYDQGEPQLVNVKFINQNDDNGTVEMTFDAVTPVHVKGSIDDPRITKVLARALVNERNPGVRLKTVSTISDQTKIQPSMEKEVKASLITVLKYDQNPGVRKEALKALQKFPVDDDIVEGILFVLKNEKNTGMRIAAINFLDFTKLSGQSVDKDLLTMLKEKMQSDDNNYIRIRGNAAFQEVKK